MTAIECISAVSKALAPMLISKAKHINTSWIASIVARKMVQVLLLSPQDPCHHTMKEAIGDLPNRSYDPLLIDYDLDRNKLRMPKHQVSCQPQ